MNAFATACRMPATQPIDDPNLESFSYRGWRERVQRVLHSPKKPIERGVASKLLQQLALD
jgi:hypothetical protein